MSARPSRRHASKTDQAKQRLEQLKRLKEDGKKRLDDIDGDEDVANVYDEGRSPFPYSSSFFPQSPILLSNVNRKIQKMCALCHRLFSFVFVFVVVSRLLL